MTSRKALLILFMLISFLPIVLIQIPDYGPSSSTTTLLMIGHLASRIGLAGAILLLWSYLLGIRRITGKFIQDQIWINKLHQQIGTYGYLFIFLHPALIVYSLSESITYALFLREFIEYELFVSAGRLGFIILTFIWVTSALVRGKMSYRLWKILHFAAYLILPLIFIHGLRVGSILTSNSFVYAYWIFLIAIFVLTLLIRILFEFGAGKVKYRVIAINEITYDTNEYILEAVGKPISPEVGQYGYISRKIFGESHPFTIARAKENGKQIGFAIKTLGNFTRILREAKIGDELLIDGPYGVFTKEAFTTEKTPVLIAGGIGITPFLRLIPNLSNHKDITLIYGNKTLDDIPFREELESQLGNKLVHVLSNTKPEEITQIPKTQIPIETGFITIDLIKKYLGDEIERYEYFICGPPIMMKLVSQALYKAGVEKSAVHMEKFSI